MHASKLTSMCQSVKTFFTCGALGLWVHFTPASSKTTQAYFVALS